MASLLSVNGELRSLYEPVSVDARRSTGYEPVGIGKPLVVRYLYRLIRIVEGDRRQVLVSTYVKTREEKLPAAEVITFYDGDAASKFKNGLMHLSDFGGKTYGHELCYYTKSYRGESIRLTSVVHEIDNNQVAKAIAGAVGQIAALPMFSSMLPIAAGVSIGSNLFQRLVDIFNRDDLVSQHDIDLHYDRLSSRMLQSGRIVCIPGAEDSDFLPNGSYSSLKLNPENRLIFTEGPKKGTPFTEQGYYVIQIDAKQNDLYNDFDAYKGAADIIALTNRGSGGAAGDILQITAEAVRAANDVAAIRRIENLSVDIGNPKAAERIQAEYRALSPEMQRVYKERVQRFVSRP